MENTSARLDSKAFREQIRLFEYQPPHRRYSDRLRRELTTGGRVNAGQKRCRLCSALNVALDAGREEETFWRVGALRDSPE